jgi:hypothetical protein
MSSSVDTAVPTIVLVILVTLIGVIYGTLELYDNESSAWDVLKDLLSGDITLWDIWEGKKDRSGVCAGPDKNAAYEYDEKGNCTFIGCKPGYFEQNGICIQQRNRSDDLTGGVETVDCELDPDEPYTYGQCLHPVTRRPLTGSIGSCGTGRRSMNPNVINGGIGVGSTCEEPSEEDCSVPCPLECEAPESLWVPVEDAPCVGTSGRHLGVPIDEGNGVYVTYHGEGQQEKKIVDISEIPVGLYASTHTNAQEYADSINYNKCVDKGSVNKLCKIEPTSTSKWMGCPLPSTDLGWVDHDNGAVFTKDSAEAYMADASKFKDLVKEPAVSRERAIELGVLDDKGQEIDLNKMPKGYKIKYKAINNLSYASALENDCTIVVLEEAPAPRDAEDCVIEDVGETCYSVACGARHHKKVTPTVSIQAWGLGTCYPGNTYTDTETCDTFALPCCEEEVTGHYELGACNSETGIRSFTQDTSNCITNVQIGESPVDPITFERDCPVDCVVGEWVNEGGCTAGGLQKQTRPVLTERLNTGEPCGDTTQWVDCAVNCTGYWTDYGNCNKDCGGGRKQRRWIVTNDEINGGTCDLRGVRESIDCNTQVCPRPCIGSWDSSGCGIERGFMSTMKYSGDATYRVTGTALGGGEECPHQHLETRECGASDYTGCTYATSTCKAKPYGSVVEYAPPPTRRR